MSINMIISKAIRGHILQLASKLCESSAYIQRFTNLAAWRGACPRGRCVWRATGRSRGCRRGCGPTAPRASALASRTRRGPAWSPRSAERGLGWKYQPTACGAARWRTTAAHLDATHVSIRTADTLYFVIAHNMLQASFTLTYITCQR